MASSLVERARTAPCTLHPAKVTWNQMVCSYRPIAPETPAEQRAAAQRARRSRARIGRRRGGSMRDADDNIPDQVAAADVVGRLPLSQPVVVLLEVSENASGAAVDCVPEIFLERFTSPCFRGVSARLLLSPSGYLGAQRVGAAVALRSSDVAAPRAFSRSVAMGLSGLPRLRPVAGGRACLGCVRSRCVARHRRAWDRADWSQ